MEAKAANEKAKQLVDKFSKTISAELTNPYAKIVGKQCALICVDEMLSVLNGLGEHLHRHTTWVQMDIDFYKKVKTEIKNL